MHDVEETGNLVEAGVWMLVALALAIKAVRVTTTLRRMLMILSGTFVVFGVSDIIESSTGAWWRPIWLPLIKGACLVVFFFGFRAYYRIVKSMKTSSNASQGVVLPPGG